MPAVQSRSGLQAVLSAIPFFSSSRGILIEAKSSPRGPPIQTGHRQDQLKDVDSMVLGYVETYFGEK